MSIFSNLFAKHTPFDLNGITDWHSHILPGVDDGVQDLETSLAILDDYEQAGIKNLWLTPHIMEDMPNTTDALRKRFDELMAAYKGNINIRLAAENMMDNLFDQRLAKKDFLPIGDRKEMLLVETSYFSAPIRFKEILKEVMSAGYYPLLAHPERYNYINSLKEY